jgi:purine-binding chemotaxis protein CheW
MEEHLVILELRKEFFGLEISVVESIIKMQGITSMPRAPEFVEGVTNLRGMVVPVIDLRKRFNLPVAENTNNTRIVIVTLGKTKVGMVVDGVSEVLRVPQDAIEPTPPIVTSVDTAFIRGIAKVNERLVTLLDLNKVLNPLELNAVENMAV